MKIQLAAIAGTVAALAVTLSAIATAAVTHPAVDLVAWGIHRGG